MSVEFPMNRDKDSDELNIERLVTPQIGEENELEAGEYILVVPEGQKAIVRYESDE
jgi:hypothetical protein